MQIDIWVLKTSQKGLPVKHHVGTFYKKRDAVDYLPKDDPTMASIAAQPVTSFAGKSYTITGEPTLWLATLPEHLRGAYLWAEKV